MSHFSISNPERMSSFTSDLFCCKFSTKNSPFLSHCKIIYFLLTPTFAPLFLKLFKLLLFAIVYETLRRSKSQKNMRTFELVRRLFSVKSLNFLQKFSVQKSASFILFRIFFSFVLVPFSLSNI